VGPRRMPEQPDPPHRAAAPWLLVLGALAIVGLVLIYFAGGPHRVLALVGEQGDKLHGLVARFGVGAALVFIVAYAALMTTLWVPAWPCTVTAGFLFGLWPGALCALAGATLGATAVFALARRGLSGVTRRADPFVRRFESGFRRSAFSYLLALRLVPFIPFNAVNVLSGIVGMRLGTYVLATVLGMVPSTLIYASFGHGLESLLRDDAARDTSIWSRPALVMLLVGLAVIALVPAGYGMLKRTRGGP